MELSLEQIWNLRDPLAKLAEVPMSVTAGYRIGKLYSVIQSEFVKINEQRNVLAKQACEKAGVPDATQVPAEAMQEFLGKFSEFLGGEDSIDVPVRTVNAQSLNGNLTPMDLMVLIDCGIIAGLED